MKGLPYKMKTRVLLLFMLLAVMELNGENGNEHSLACYKCDSETSWEDCDKNMHGMNCSAKYSEVCIKVERTWWDDQKNSSELKTSYARYCTLAEDCTKKECRERKWECKIDCCFTNMCNTSIITSPHALLIGVFLCLALESISAF
ncbi:uncharacterized protein LOC110063410 [Orbicella faveolata]|uniref:uncharacterized protein LOC110063410 n=1 Tax=Orbicella faveolata TaxID=48498 RepID=UPI0009E4D72A|nr:uncharacterized protein LOC110063410 [Orbicella faveolata]